MCGIGGIIKKNAKVSKDNLTDLIAPIVHRGPDGSGVWIHENENLGFAHRRLSIIDLSENGAQPFHRKDLGLTITFNGEIYNYIEVREGLAKKGYEFNTLTDTEVILVAYKEYGVQCLTHFDGMFAFAIWDESKKELFCARDRFGEKPFHYYKNEEQFVFASEIKQFWSYSIEKQIDPHKLNMFLSSSEVLDDGCLEKTFYKTIFSLKAAHYLILRADLNFEIQRYWDLEGIKVDKTVSFPNAIERLNELFNRSISRRLRSDVAVGSSLSGGLDSSSIVYSINKHFLKPGQEQFTFSARFKNYAKDEGEFIDALISELKGIKRFDVFLSPEEFENDIEKIIYHQDEPFQSASIFAQYKVMELVKKNGITVLLDGQGADELLGGYETLYRDYLKQLFYNDGTLYKQEVKSFNEMHSEKYGEVNMDKGDTLIKKAKRSIKHVIGKPQAVPDDFFFGILKEYSTGRQLQQLLRYADRNSMAHSVETRLPFLSHELAEFIFSLPDSYKLRDGWPKYIVRKAFDGKLPDKINWRRNKVGFETPESNFLNTSIAINRISRAKEYMEDNKGKVSSQNVSDWSLFMVGCYLEN
jgi:asparagine synthase (glutamine-hydrolysing)